MVSIDYMVVADAAIAAEGKHYIHGGGWDSITGSSLPLIHPSIAIAFLIRVPWAETNMPFSLELDVLDADAASILPTPPGPVGGPMTVGRPPNAIPANPLLVPMVFTLNGLAFAQPGDYVFVIRVNGEERARFPIHIVVNLPQSNAATSPPH